MQFYFGSLAGGKFDEAPVERFLQVTINLENRIGIAAPVVIAFAIHESSSKSELFLNAGNPFGTKASNPWISPSEAVLNIIQKVRLQELVTR